MEAPEEAELCFPRINSSCRRTLLPHSELISSVLSCITLLTVALNLLMPVLLLHNQGCWYLGDLMCGVNGFLGFVVISVSVGSMVLISVDRYVAICEPMFYTSRVTLKRARALRGHIAAVERSESVKATRSELKAARTLGIVIVVFLLCSFPYYCFAVAAQSNLVGASKTIKHIVTLKILQPGSREDKVL
ncbi:unnamed protein product [Pleuronectes platessa]|uniref:G-protein coupled receptors family 1 profile domain-containing protein n=1 Tax=Pleuronectes platessa TaxID=8262 RepID=A0A9N7V1C5_PLEPL|nr:unnamed protein product [Pleuronectes platessa]